MFVMLERIQEGNDVLFVWSRSETSVLQSLVGEIKEKIKHGTIAVEHAERLTLGSRALSSFDFVISNWLHPNCIKHTDQLLTIFVKMLKPGGTAVLKEVNLDISSQLKLSGFIDVEKIGQDIFIARKPNFEIGSQTKLKLKTLIEPKVDILKAWTVDNDDDIIDSDQLLDEDDLKTPDVNSLKVCSTTGKRKACADCSCGLAEELRGETKETPKSSCGSCYLGDAFRCSTCPYLGMPAFKPGEKVLLADLNPDI